MKIVFAVSEVEDLIKTGGLADVGKCLPLSLAKLGHDVRIILPLYKMIAESTTLTDACPPQHFHANGNDYQFQVKQLLLHGITVYLIDQPDYFYRDGLYSDHYDAYSDNGQRFAFFSEAILHGLSNIGFIPDIIHCNDWHTGLVPYFMRHSQHRHLIDEFQTTKSLLSIHNAAFQGVYDINDVPILANHHHIPYSYDGTVNFLKAGLAVSDFNSTVSRNYAKELLTDLGSHGLSVVLQTRADKLVGILNGCDYSQWDPATDEHIKAHFDGSDLTGKARCKKALQTYAKLPNNKRTPLIGMVCRLTEQKGFGYILPILEQLLQHNVQLVIIGTGDPSVVEQLNVISKSFSDKFAFIEGFSNKYAHWVEAGADFFLMPSQFEPCGLNQMYSLAYGTLPIVRAVGGLKDTVEDVEQSPDIATGFRFEQPQPSALLHCIRRALLCYHEYPELFADIQKRAMATRFTWDIAAQQYVSLYERIINE